MTKKILFICHGNICRSPMAEFITKKIVKDLGKENEYEIASAATTEDAIISGIGHDIDVRSQRVMNEHGIPFNHRQARKMVKSDYEKYDYIIGMDEENFFDMNHISAGDPERKEYKLLSFAGSMMDVDDPWYTGDFEAAYQDIYQGCEALIKKIEMSDK
ncbi:low molecular weight protein-tyrosine-phosphatase [Lactobacillus johnsonii]|jgi:protein-tyrosine phosphatase|uniref:protein-tyrosine-phosphatase n=2 Tax=Lactobacillus johnsonii TaxID=33959 RepID=A0A9X7TI16_LACJH|nr:low molecular weight protein-tyrosine-phosphatase [Lactobacillus johnsonii]AHA97507.1 phosphotyrosine protein phosphatase [Lactobacillus johnsonii N6.2]KOH02665.1 protein tyrosine phosphatase [Lactobacillus johnsonii 16]QIA87743.1 low molecular weight phosphotyrosine protein phosphatase [Lactobacillus johnsonii]TGY27193.1 low molecular weight phosphotyrosine protein phosphatase [Lactobacillus johnsonii]